MAPTLALPRSQKTRTGEGIGCAKQNAPVESRERVQRARPFKVGPVGAMKLLD
jgi:hypothetical protein